MSRLDALRIRRDGAATVLDMSPVRWLDPLHLVVAAALAHAAVRAGGRFLLHGLEGEAARYASRMHLGEVVAGLGGEHELPDVPEHDRSDSLLEVRRVGSGDDVRGLAALVHDQVAPIDDEIADALHCGIGEVGANVLEHSGTFGFVAAQTLPRRATMRFAVADSGVGLLRTLAGCGATSDRGAVSLALSGVSSVDGPGRGTGLPSTVGHVTRLGGELLLASGTAGAYATARGRRHITFDHAFTGTVVEGAVPVALGRHSRERFPPGAEQ